MPARRLPLRPDLDQLKHQAKDLLHALHSGEAEALEDLKQYHPDTIEPASAKLADAQLILARSYGAPSWARLGQAVDLAEAIRSDDLDVVRDLVTRNPALITEPMLIKQHAGAGTEAEHRRNYGPPMSYAARFGRDRIVMLLRDLGARDFLQALGEAVLQGQVETSRMLYEMANRPAPPDGILTSTAFNLNVEGTALLFEMGARVRDEAGRLLAPVDTVLQTSLREPEKKHALLEMYAANGLDIPDTPAMAVHRGRIDLLEEHLHRDPDLPNRRISSRDIYPAEMGCSEPVNAVIGTPLDGGTLLHMCVEYDEMEIAKWLIANGADVNTQSSTDVKGFGGFTALFSSVVSMPNYWMNKGNVKPSTAPYTELLLAHGADPNMRVSIQKQPDPMRLHPSRTQYFDVSPLSWGRRFEGPSLVSQWAMELIASAGGLE